MNYRQKDPNYQPPNGLGIVKYSCRVRDVLGGTPVGKSVGRRLVSGKLLIIKRK